MMAEKRIVVVRESGKHGLAQTITAGPHTFVADEPKGIGDDTGPTPYELLLAALGACTSMTLRMYADRKNWPLEHITVELTHNRVHSDDARNCESAPCMLDRIERRIQLDGPLTAEQRARLLELAEKCPVHRTLVGAKEIVTSAAEAGPSAPPSG
jgi:uncharacterized OsmC-like protein